jgi:hypothetical protein
MPTILGLALSLWKDGPVSGSNSLILFENFVFVQLHRNPALHFLAAWNYSPR